MAAVDCVRQRRCLAHQGLDETAGEKGPCVRDPSTIVRRCSEDAWSRPATVAQDDRVWWLLTAGPSLLSLKLSRMKFSRREKARCESRGEAKSPPVPPLPLPWSLSAVPAGWCAE